MVILFFSSSLRATSLLTYPCLLRGCDGLCWRRVVCASAVWLLCGPSSDFANFTSPLQVAWSSPARCTQPPSRTAMRLKKHVPLFESTLRPAIPRRVAPPVCNRCRRYATSGASPENIAVLGGGISGLSSAYFISKEFPTSKITIFESGKATGGWIRSRRVDVPGGDILFEYGPRTLRPGLKAAPTAQLVSWERVPVTKLSSKSYRSKTWVLSRASCAPNPARLVPAIAFFTIQMAWSACPRPNRLQICRYCFGSGEAVC